jgi:lambda repressor-like predicted transcriptional regulator
MCRYLVEAASTNPDPQKRAKCAALAISAGSAFMDMAMVSDSFEWDDICGENGKILIDNMRAYTYASHHSFTVRTFNGDWSIQFPCFYPLLLRWVDFENSVELADIALSNIPKVLTEPDQAPEHASMMLGPSGWCSMYYATGFKHGREKVIDIMNQVGLTYKTAEETFDGCLTRWMRKRGDDTLNLYYCSAEYGTWMAQLGYISLAESPGVTDAEVLGSLPTVDAIIQSAMVSTEMSMMGQHGSLWSLFFSAAAACEKLGDAERVLLYADAGLSRDLKRSGCQLPTQRCALSSLRGRALATLGQFAEAGRTLEDTASEAHRYDLRLYEIYALLDLKLLVLDDMGHGDHASRRLGAVLRLLSGQSPETLTPLLKGLDAAELMALPPPVADYKIVYETEDSAVAALREELQGMRLKELRKRARAAGLTEDELDDAVDSDDPKGAVIAQLLGIEAAAEAAAAEAAMTSRFGDVGRLKTLKLSELRKMATEAGVDHGALEDALDTGEPKGAVVALMLALD